jgi:hypothetical protein
MKKIIISLTALIMASIANATNTTNYVADGQFESPNGDVGPWQNTFGGDTISFLSTGGNPDGCVQISDAGSYGGIAYVNPPTSNQPTLASLGLTAGQTYTFVMDMQIVSGTSIGGLKVESWSDTAALGNSGDMRPLSGTANWATYTFTYKISAGATHLNLVPLWGANSTVNYDNIGVVVPGPTAATVTITSPTNNQVVFSPFTINATATVNPGSVTNVSFYVDNVFAGRSTNAPFSYIASGVSAGAHALKAVAIDSNGNSATSSVVNIVVTNGAAPAFSAYESFNYSQGDLVNGTPTTASGFTGNWSCGVNGVIVSGLSYPNLGGTNNALQSSSTFQLESLSTAPSGISNIWVSFIFNQAGDNGGNRDGFVMEDSTGKGVMFAYQQFQATVGQPGITTVNGFTAVGTQLAHSSVTQTYNANNLYVVKLSYSGGALSGVSVYSNPTAGPGQTTPPTADFSVSSGLSGIGVLSVLGVLHQGGISLTVDEVRVGTNYASVVGANLNPTVPTTLGLAIAPAAKVSWTANATNYYQPQSSTDGVNWNNVGNQLFGNSVTSIFDSAPSPFYQVQEILPTLSETIQDGGFEISDGGSGAFYWPLVGGSQLPTVITSDFHSGAACMQLFVTNTTTAAQISDLQQNVSGSGGPGIVGGSSYTFSFWAKSLGKNPAGGYVQQYKVTWLNSGNAIVGSVGFNNFTGGSGTWTQTTTGPVVAPATAVNVVVEFRIATGGILNDFGGVLVDDVSLSASSPGGTINIIPATVQTGAVFTATVKVGGSVAPAASGNITFLTNGVVQSVATVVNGVASGTPVIMPANYTVTANYLGDATYIASSASLTVGSVVNTTPTNIVLSVSGGQLTLSWPSDHTGWTLQAQTNALATGLRGVWVDVAGSTATNQVVIPINRSNPTVFYRLKY